MFTYASILTRNIPKNFEHLRETLLINRHYYNRNDRSYIQKNILTQTKITRTARLGSFKVNKKVF